MIRINQIKIPISALWALPEEEQKKAELSLLYKKAAKALKVREDAIRKLKILRRSADAREKNNICFSYLISVKLHDSVAGPSGKTEAAFIERLHDRNITAETEVPFQLPKTDRARAEAAEAAQGRPLIVGAGPCGLFAAHTLAKLGFHPVLIERGDCVERRREKTELFFQTGKLDPESNVQFGEGGAGTFSDGKLNTSIKGQGSLIRYVLEQFCAYGADPSILYDQKPHIGTDVLSDVVKKMREDILSMGGSVLFGTKLLELLCRDGRLCGARVLVRADGKNEEEIRELFCSRLILAIGHSARDTLSALYGQDLRMEQKGFAMGLRIQHPQRLIDEALYGSDHLAEKEAILGPASYKLSHRLADGRSIYSFCMCPGGYVVNASSEAGRLCVNGMSRHDRGSGNANAALIVNVGTEDFPSAHPLSGVTLQRSLEERAYALCGGAIPSETFGDFKEWKKADFSKSAYPASFCGAYDYADLRSALPGFISDALIEGMEAFGRQIPGFDDPDALLSFAETRTSSPVRIVRDAGGEGSIRGVYPAGEGAGYAGGITSAAIDGIRQALSAAQAFLDEEGKSLDAESGS